MNRLSQDNDGYLIGDCKYTILLYVFLRNFHIVYARCDFSIIEKANKGATVVSRTTERPSILIWANQVLKQYLISGFAINQERLKAHQEKIIELRTRSACFRALLIERRSRPTKAQVF